MTDRTSPWQQLGVALIQRRTQLDQRYSNRRVFTDEAHLDYRLVYDIELAKRQNFGTATLTTIELAYRLPVGAIRRFLDDGEPFPDLTDSAAPAPQKPKVEVPLIDDDIAEDAEYIKPYVMRVLREHFANVPVTDEREARVWAMSSLNEEQKSQLIGWMRWYSAGQPGLPEDVRNSRLYRPVPYAGWGVLAAAHWHLTKPVGAMREGETWPAQCRAPSRTSRRRLILTRGITPRWNERPALNCAPGQRSHEWKATRLLPRR